MYPFLIKHFSENHFQYVRYGLLFYKKVKQTQKQLKLMCLMLINLESNDNFEQQRLLMMMIKSS